MVCTLKVIDIPHFIWLIYWFFLFYNKESLEYARQHLIACRSAGVDKTMLIVGKGSHSQPGGPRIGPAISDMLRGIAGIVADAHENNSGAIVVEFTRC